jgi:predicted nucleic acid-binding protein
VILYAESSAVLAWILGETTGARVSAELAGAEDVVASVLTTVECDRALVRAVAAGWLRETEAIDRRSLLHRAAGHWSLLGIDEDVLARARRPYPLEPLRTLDALHLASALSARSELPGLEVLSLDDRVRANARALGLPVRPGEEA